MTPTPVPLTVLDIDSVTVLKSHAFTLIVLVIILIAVIKWILPQLTAYLNKRMESNSSDKALLQATIKRIVEGQEKMNEAIISKLESIDLNMKEIKEMFVNSLKAGLKVLGLFFLLGSLNCDSDTITVYKFKEKAAPVQIQPEGPKTLDVLDEPKECSPSCSPPKTKCNRKTGKCEGQSLQRSPTSDLNYLVEKYGSISSGIPQWQR